jgi:hypothetical protein
VMDRKNLREPNASAPLDVDRVGFRDSDQIERF